MGRCSGCMQRKISPDAESTMECANSFEFALRSGLAETDAAGGDIGFEIILAFYRGLRETAEHGDLPDVGECVGDRPLKKLVNGSPERLGGREVIIELFYSSEEAIDFGVPGEGRGVVPNLLASRHGKRPIEEIAKVSEDLGWSARFVTDGKAGKGVGRAAQGFASTIGDGGYSVSKELAGGIGRCGHG